jgi:hypothetical protein
MKKILIGLLVLGSMSTFASPANGCKKEAKEILIKAGELLKKSSSYPATNKSNVVLSYFTELEDKAVTSSTYLGIVSFDQDDTLNPRYEVKFLYGGGDCILDSITNVKITYDKKH